MRLSDTFGAVPMRCSGDWPPLASKPRSGAGASGSAAFGGVVSTEVLITGSDAGTPDSWSDRL